MMRLNRCRTIWGTAEIIADPPGTETVSDALYLPVSDGQPWGLYDGKRQLTVPDRRKAADLEDSAAWIAEAAPDAEYIYVGPLVLHYGHFITDSLSRFWPLAYREGPRPKLLCHPLADRATLEQHAFLAAMLAGLDMTLDDLVTFDRPVRIRRVTVPDLSFHERADAHAVFGRLCRMIGQRHWQAEDVDRTDRPVYLSKARLGAGISQLANEQRVADALDRRGVEIVFPETLSFGEQVRLLAQRRMILGLTGSALHTTAFSAPARRIIALNWAYHLNANFAIFDALNGNQAYYYWANGTTYDETAGFSVRWTVPEPDRVADELLRSAESFARLDARDAAEDAMRERHSRGLGARLRRWKRRSMSERGLVNRDGSRS